MPEPTLNLQKSEYESEIGFYLGWGRAPTDWDDEQQVEIKNLLLSAQRNFYFAAQLPNESVYGWTFLKPVATIPLITNQDAVDLPADFAGFEGQGTLHLDGQGGGFWPINQVHEEHLRALYKAAPTSTGRPIYYADLAVKGTAPQASNRCQVQVYPLPDNDYVLTVPYYFAPDALTASRPFPYGGAVHAETMKAGCRAAAEHYLDNKRQEERANYNQLLAASISYDRRHQPKTLGPNTDSSDWRLHRRFGGRAWPDGLWHPLGIGFIGQGRYS